MPSCTCADQHHSIRLQQLGRRCLHRTLRGLLSCITHRRALVDVQPAATCKLTSVQARQPWLWMAPSSLTVTTREDRCAAGHQVHVVACMSMSACSSLCSKCGSKCATNPANCVFSTRATAGLWQCPWFTVRLSAAAMHVHWHAVRVE